MDRDPIIAFKLGATFQLADGTPCTVKCLANNVVKAFTLLSPEDAYDMCIDKFAGNMTTLGNYLLQAMRGKTFDGLFTFRCTTSCARTLSTCSGRNIHGNDIWDLLHVYKINQVVFHIHTLPCLYVGP